MINKTDAPVHQIIQSKPYSNQNVAAAFCYLYAILFFLWGFVNEYTFTILFDETSVNPITPYQTAAFVIGLINIIMGWMFQKVYLPVLFYSKWIILTQLAISSLVVPVLILEMVLDPFYDMPQKEVSIFMKDERLGWRLKPNLNEYYGGFPVRTNSLGLRGAEIILPLPKNKQRILFLGDSVTFGLRIEQDEKTLPLQTAALLASELENPAEVVNAGVPGYNTYQEYVYLREEGLSFHPDIVVLCFVLNDVVNTYTMQRYGDYGADSPVAFLTDSPITELLRHSSMVHAVQYWKNEWRSRFFSRENAIYEELFSAQVLIDRADHDETKKAWDITQNYLSEIHELCDEQNIPFLITAAPYRFQFQDPQGNTIPQNVLQSYCIKRGIHFLDLLPALLDYKEKVDDSASALFQDDCHFTELGLELCAQQIANTIIQYKMLKNVADLKE